MLAVSLPWGCCVFKHSNNHTNSSLGLLLLFSLFSTSETLKVFNRMPQIHISYAQLSSSPGRRNSWVTSRKLLKRSDLKHKTDKPFSKQQRGTSRQHDMHLMGTAPPLAAVEPNVQAEWQYSSTPSGTGSRSFRTIRNFGIRQPILRTAVRQCLADKRDHRQHFTFVRRRGESYASTISMRRSRDGKMSTVTDFAPREFVQAQSILDFE